MGAKVEINLMKIIDKNYDTSLWFREIVDRNLKQVPVSESELLYLRDHPGAWKYELVNFKKRTETQFTSSRARMLSSYADCYNKITTYPQYLILLHDERVWRVHAAKFLQLVEKKIQAINSGINDNE